MQGSVCVHRVAGENAKAVCTHAILAFVFFCKVGRILDISSLAIRNIRYIKTASSPESPREVMYFNVIDWSSS